MICCLVGGIDVVVHVDNKGGGTKEVVNLSKHAPVKQISAQTYIGKLDDALVKNGDINYLVQK